MLERKSIEGDEISNNNKNSVAKKKTAYTLALIQAFNNIVDYKSTVDIFDKVISASCAIESSDRNKERGSASCERKEKSLRGRWYEKYDPQSKKDVNTHGSVNDLFIERNILVSIKIKLKSSRIKQMITKDHHVLGLYKKIIQ